MTRPHSQTPVVFGPAGKKVQQEESPYLWEGGELRRANSFTERKGRRKEEAAFKRACLNA